MMPELKCWRCQEFFEYDHNDTRPFIYHECKPDVFVEHKNPNLVKKPHKWYPKPEHTSKQKTFWQDFYFK